MNAEMHEIMALVCCFISSGFFSGSEAVLMSISPDRAHQLIQHGGSKGKALSFMIERPNEILTTILVGNNIVNILAASLTTTIASRTFKDDAIGISVGITTILILLFGEIIPKTFARARAEALATSVIRVLQGIYYLMYPIVRLTTFVIARILGENAQLVGRIVRKQDIEYMLGRAEKEKTMDSKQLELLNSILEFPTIKVKDIMIPRSRVKYLLIDAHYSEVMNIIQQDSHSRYPVCEKDLDHVMGFLHVKDLAFLNKQEKMNFEAKNYLKPPFFVYEHMKIQAVFDHMNRKKVHLGLVKDENGLVVGIITLEDIVEEIVGEIQDEHDPAVISPFDDEDALTRGAQVEGSISLRDLNNDYDIKIPLNDNYSTLNGFLLDMLGNTFPEVGQIIVWEGLSFELIKVEDQEIQTVLIKDVDDEKHYFSKRDVAKN